MKKNHLNHFVNELLQSAEKSLNEYTRLRKPLYLHRLRVNIKKIKAVISFAEKTYKEKYNASYLDELFKKAGKIREIQININLLRKFSELPYKIVTAMQKKENMLNQQFIHDNLLHNELLRKFRDGFNLPEKLPGKKIINAYFKKERHKANKLILKEGRENTHRYRIRIKKIMYLYNALPNKIQTAINLNVTEINKQQKKLGNWHDTYSVIHFLSSENLYKMSYRNTVLLYEKETNQFNSLDLKPV